MVLRSHSRETNPSAAQRSASTFSTALFQRWRHPPQRRRSNGCSQVLLGQDVQRAAAAARHGRSGV